MTTAAETAIAHYLSKGLSKDVAVGLTAVLNAESSLNPLAENNSGTDTGGVLNPQGSYGLAQWNGPRQQALATFAQKKGLSPSDMGVQLDFVLTEAANSYPELWAAIQKSGTTYPDLITAMVDTYEIPADKPAEIARAIGYAKNYYTMVVEPAPVSTPTPMPVPTPAPLNNNALIVSLAQAIIKLAGG